jgi:hypothetical protein
MVNPVVSGGYVFLFGVQVSITQSVLDYVFIDRPHGLHIVLTNESSGLPSCTSDIICQPTAP